MHLVSIFPFDSGTQGLVFLSSISSAFFSVCVINPKTQSFFLLPDLDSSPQLRFSFWGVVFRTNFRFCKGGMKKKVSILKGGGVLKRKGLMMMLHGFHIDWPIMLTLTV